MAEQRDVILIERARLRRQRLGAALLYGPAEERRTVNDNVRRLIGSISVAAVAAAACVGVGFVLSVIGAQTATPSVSASPTASAQ